MKKLFLLAFLTVQTVAFGQFPGLAPTPPMGWNSWNAFGMRISSKLVRAMADSMVSKGMAKAGYQYIVIDDGWQVSRDKSGRIVADSVTFPEGIKALVDYVHSKGLKFGIYTCCGTKTCGGRPASYGYEALDAETYAQWGVDYIKEDWCFTDGLTTRTQYKIMSDAIRATGRPMILSLCEWGTSSPWEWAKGVGALWRTTGDIQDCKDCGASWLSLIEKNADLAPYAGPGHWNDPDMLEVGNRSLNLTECRSHFAMWCMLAAPLMAGNDLRNMQDSIRDILTAPEIIAIDQDPLGIQATRIRNINGLQVWQKPLSDGSLAIALLNANKTASSISFSLDEIGIKRGSVTLVRDLWERKNLRPIDHTFTALVEPRGIVVLNIKGEKAAVSKLEFGTKSLTLNKGNHNVFKLSVVPFATAVNVHSSNENVIAITQAGVNQYRMSALKEGTAIIKASSYDGKFTDECVVNVVSSNIPAPWVLTDVDDNKASATYDKGVFTLEGGGSDIWSSSDQFAFLHQKTNGDVSLSARILTQSNPDEWAKTGLMFREKTDPNSMFVMICVTPGNGLSLQWRGETGVSCDKKDLGKFSLPLSLKLTKKGNTFVAYKSSDGQQWERLGETTPNHFFANDFSAGLVSVSHSNVQLNTSTFDRVLLSK